MLEIHEVHAQLSPNRVCEGFYTIDGDLLRMVYSDGRPVERSPDVFFERRLREGDNEIAIAKLLTKYIREYFRDEKHPGPKVEGFDRDMNYPRDGLA